MATARDADRPPRFLEGELVRVVGITGSETFDDGEPLDAAALVGEELLVRDAYPNSDEDGWLIGVWGAENETDDWIVLFAEDSLASTGMKEVVADTGPTSIPLDADGNYRWPVGEISPFDRGKEPGWRDTIELYLVPDLNEEEVGRHPLLDWLFAQPDCLYWYPERREDADHTEAAAIGWRAADALGEAVGQEVELAFVEDDHDHPGEEYDNDLNNHPFGILLWFEPAGDVFSVFDRIVSSPAREWEHDIEEGMHFEARWPASRWRRPPGEDAVFITPGVREAVVIFRCWTTPRWNWSHKSMSR